MSNNITVEPTFPFRTSTSVVYSDGGSAGVPELVNRALAELKPTPPDRAFILVSNSLQKNHPEVVDGLRKALGEKLVGERIGMGSHSPWNEIIEVAEEWYVLGGVYYSLVCSCTCRR